MVYVIAFILCVWLFLIGYMAGSVHGYDKGFEDCRLLTLKFIKDEMDKENNNE